MSNRTRNKRIEIYLNEDELKKLDSDREKLGLSRSEYIRGLIGRNIVDKKQNQELLNMFLEANKINSNINKLNKFSLPFPKIFIHIGMNCCLKFCLLNPFFDCRL